MKKQSSALLFCAASMPTVLLTARAGWLFAGAASVAVIFLSRWCSNGSGYLAWPRLIWNMVVLGAAADLIASAYPPGNTLIALLTLLLAAYASGCGREVVLRVGAVVAFLLIIVYALLLGFSLPCVESFRSQRNPNWMLLAAALTPLGLIGEEKPSLWATGSVAILAVLAALVSADAPNFYVAMQSVNILGVMQRLEPLVSVAMTLGGFCLLASICNVNSVILEKRIPQRKNYFAAINFLCGAAGLWLSRQVTVPFLAIGTAIFWGVFSLLPQSLDNSKKFEKKQKKT